jgi:hypothetical protein
MSELPAYLWALTLFGILALAAAVCIVLFRGAVNARLGTRTAVLLTTGTAVVIGSWYAVSAAIGAGGGYRAQLGRQVPWMPIAVVGFALLLLALSRIRIVRRALAAPGMRGQLVLPHAFRAVEGAVFVIAMFIGHLPALFAIPAGFGDIAVGIAAPFVARKLAHGSGRLAARRFNILGIADLVTALTLGAVTGFQLIHIGPSAQALSDLPLVLIPTAAVPLLLVLHIVSLSARPHAPHAGASVAEPVEAYRSLSPSKRAGR